MRKSMWCAATLQAGGRSRAEANLGRQGFAPYSPRCLADDGTEAVDLFPGYILIDLRGLEPRPIEATRGVGRLVRLGDKVCLAGDEEIGKIKAAEGPDGLVRRPRILKPRRFRPEQAVKLHHGGPHSAFHGSIVIYQGPLPGERASVLLHILGRGVPLVVREDDLAAA